MARSCASLALRMSLPSNRISPVGCDAELGNSRRIDIADTVFPEPDSPTSATVSPLPIVNDTLLTTRAALAPSPKATERLRTSTRGWPVVISFLVCLNVFRGSSASRMASPMKIASDRMMDTEIKPEMPSQGASRCFFPSSRSSPSDGDPGGIPRPKKSSAVRAAMPPESLNGTKVSVATIAFGNRCLNMICQSERPKARAARTYSRLRPRRNSARTRPTSDVQEKISRMPSSVQNPGTNSDDSMSSTKSSGIEFQISRMRWKIRSVLPPK